MGLVTDTGIGKSVRMRRLCRGDGLFLVPIDHSVTDGPIGSVDRVRRIVETIARNGADGAPLADTGELSALVREMMSSGAASVAMGRNIFHAKNVAQVTREIAGIVHGSPGRRISPPALEWDTRAPAKRQPTWTEPGWSARRAGVGSGCSACCDLRRPPRLPSSWQFLPTLPRSWCVWPCTLRGRRARSARLAASAQPSRSVGAGHAAHCPARGQRYLAGCAQLLVPRLLARLAVPVALGSAGAHSTNPPTVSGHGGHQRASASGTPRPAGDGQHSRVADDQAAREGVRARSGLAVDGGQ